MCSAYQADLICDSCAQRIAAELDAEGIADNGDSDTYPQAAGSSEADSPSHCASQSACLEAIDLCDYGMSPRAHLIGAEDRYIGAVVTDALTTEGLDYVRDTIDEGFSTAYQAALYRLWGELYV